MKLKTCLLAATMTAAATASASEWTGNESTDWFDPLNWTSGVPTAGSNSVRINTAAEHPTEIDGQSAATGSGFGVGHSGAGVLFITNGATLNSVSANLGSQVAGHGSVIISGAGSSWQVASGNFDIGQSGSGQLDVLAGGVLQTLGSLSHIGQQASGSGSVTVSGAGSRWEHDNRFWLGVSGFGQMTISDGGEVVVSGTTSTVAQASSGSGELLITGAGSKLSLSTRLHIGNSGSGLMQVANGGRLEVTGTAAPGNHRLVIGANSGSQGTVIVGALPGQMPGVPGQMLLDDGLLFQNGTGTLVFNHNDQLEQMFAVLGPDTGSGHIHAENGTTLFVGEAFDYSGSLTINAGASFGAAGTLGDVVNAGRLVASPGRSATLVIDGDYSHGDKAVLEIQFGPGPVVDLVQVNGEAALSGGSVSFTMLPGDYGSQPLDGLYPILMAGAGLTGAFDGIDASNPNTFELVHDGNTVYVQVNDRLFVDRYEPGD